MKFDSIKSRLMLITAVCVMGMLFMMFNQVHYTNRLLELHEQKDSVREMSNDLLQLRRHEKDFLLRKDYEYVRKFETTYSELLSKLEQFDARHINDEFNHSQFESLQSGLYEYATLFNQLVDLQQKIGLNSQRGLLLILEKSYFDIQHHLSHSNNLGLQMSVAEVRLGEKNILLQAHSQSIQQQSQAYSELLELANSLPSVASLALFPLLDTYQNNVLDLVVALQEMGFTHQDGLRGEFRGKAHAVEEQLSEYIRDLLPQIAAEEQDVRYNSLFIMATTAIALILLLIKSFATFHNAFSNFVMFFYRCKREYQRLDERKLGFSEFKSLAALANEMVDSKKKSELKLKQLEKEISHLKLQISQR